MPPSFDRFERFGHNELTTKHYYFRCLRPSDVKIFDKDDQATKHSDKNSVLWPGHFYQNYDPSTSGSFEHLK